MLTQFDEHSHFFDLLKFRQKAHPLVAGFLENHFYVEPKEELLLFL